MPDSRSPLEESLYHWLDTESDRWRTMGLLDEERRSRLLDLYEPVVQKRPAEERLPATEVSSNRVITTLTWLGSVLLGLGVILFFASNWEAMPTSVKLALIFGSIGGSYHLGYKLRYDWGTYPRVGDALIVLGGILYGAGIWLIAQIFHIHGNTPNGILAWWLGALPVVLAVRSEPMLLLTSALAALWCCWGRDFGDPRFVYLPLWGCLMMPLVYWLRSKAGLAINLLTFAWWLLIVVGKAVPYSYFKYYSAVPCLYMLVGLSMVMAGLLHESRRDDWRRFANTYIYIGYATAMAVCYWLTFEHKIPSWYYGYSYGQAPSADKAWWLAGTVLALTAGSALVWLELRRRAAGDARETLRVYSMLAPLAVAIGFAAVPVELTLPVAVLFNLIFVAMALGGLLLGFDRQSSRLFNLSLFWFVLEIFSRYFDWFYGFMPRSLFFMGGGLLLLLGGGYLERRRREVVAKWRHA